MPLRLDHIALLVRDLDESAAFYTAIPGIREVPDPMGGGHIRWFEFAPGQRFHMQAGDISKVHVEKGTHFAFSTDDFDALLLPGGQMNPDALRLESRVIELVEEFDDMDKPIAAICHGPWLLVEADIVDGRTVTGWPSIRTDLENAGADVVDQAVAIDGNLITSRKPDDIPLFAQALIDALEEDEEEEDEKGWDEDEDALPEDEEED